MNVIKRILNSNFHFAWLILFFILHGNSGYIGLLSPGDLLILFLQYLVLAAVIFFVSKKLFLQTVNAAVYTTLFLLVFLFFEDLRIFTGKWITAISSFKIFFPLCLLILTAGFFIFKKINRPFTRLGFLLNCLFIIYVVIDIAATGKQLFVSMKKVSPVVDINYCDTCKKPSVYFVVMDEYFGAKGLREYFKYDNSNFESQLRQKGFTVIDHSRSNYRFTVFSMTSVLNMDYIKELGEQTVYNQDGFYKAIIGIKHNQVCELFAKQGYDIINYSDFDIEHHTAGLGYNLLPSQRSLISNRTMYYQAEKYLPYFIIRYTGFTKLANWLTDRYILVNELRLTQTIKDAKKNTAKPAFTYLHLNMPHTPYAYDSSGNKVVNTWFKDLSMKQQDSMYLQYLVYTNKRINSFTDSLLTATKNKAVIILMSDHGYRDAYNKSSELGHQNFFAIYDQVTNKGFQRDSITSVNTFRILFNELFKTSYPLLKDSLVTH
ncbi:MAG: sulfatase-like hydrolase/transferase [Sphingobacteriales bacterium]|nr:sulfatase-like hydrolase/transferase [Sphingobacteriales bacterium]